MGKNIDERKAVLTIRKIHRSLGIIIGILLLLHQLTIIGVFVTAGGVRISVGGPITGLQRLESPTGNPLINFSIYSIGFVTGILLIKDDLFVSGTVLSPHGYSINISGPILGLTQVVYYLPDFLSNEEKFQDTLVKQFHFDEHIVKKYRRD